MKIAVRNLGGAFYPGNAYRNGATLSSIVGRVRHLGGDQST